MDEIDAYWSDFIRVQARHMRARLGPCHPASEEDLRQAGAIGLIRTVRSPPRSTRFEQAANFRIRHEMLDEIQRSGIARRAYRDNRMRYARFLSVEDLLTCDRGALLFSDHGAQCRRAHAKALALLALWEMNRVDSRAGEAVRLHYLEGRPNREIAQSYGVHESRISQLQQAAILHVRKAWRVGL